MKIRPVGAELFRADRDDEDDKWLFAISRMQKKKICI